LVVTSDLPASLVTSIFDWERGGYQLLYQQSW